MRRFGLGQRPPVSNLPDLQPVLDPCSPSGFFPVARLRVDSRHRESLAMHSAVEEITRPRTRRRSVMPSSNHLQGHTREKLVVYRKNGRDGTGLHGAVPGVATGKMARSGFGPHHSRLRYILTILLP